MSSLISDADKIDYQNQLLQVFDTVKRPFTMYLEPDKVVISTNPNFSRFGDNSQNSNNIPLQAKPVTVYGVIKHNEKQPYLYMGGDDSQIKVKNSAGECRIKVRAADATTLFAAKSFEVDGFSYQIKGAPRPHGLLIVDVAPLYTFFLERTQ